MPTIEIASINSTGLGLNQAEFDVAIIEENKLVSHRRLFYDMLRQLSGVIVHIGNPDFKEDKEGCYFAGEIVDWSFEPTEILLPLIGDNDPTNNWGANQSFTFKLLEQYIPDVDTLLHIALDKSPTKRVCFLTDYQFGPEKEEIDIVYTISDFWTRHNHQGLRLNTMYEMYGR